MSTEQSRVLDNNGTFLKHLLLKSTKHFTLINMQQEEYDKNRISLDSSSIMNLCMQVKKGAANDPTPTPYSSGKYIILMVDTHAVHCIKAIFASKQQVFYWKSSIAS